MVTKIIGTITGGMVIDPEQWYFQAVENGVERILGIDIRPGMLIGAIEQPINLDKKLIEANRKPAEIRSAAERKYPNDAEKQNAYWAELYKDAVLENIVEPALRTGADKEEYNLARRALFITNKNVSDVPRLRELLLRIVMPKDDLGKLSAIIDKEFDYSPNDYNRFVELFFPKDKAPYISVKERTLYDWFRGKTSLPLRTVEDLNGLARAADDILGINSDVAEELRKMANQYENNGPIFDHYKFYVGRRISEMLTLLYASKQGKEIMSTSKKSEKITASNRNER